MNTARPLASIIDHLVEWGADRPRTERLIGHVEALFGDEWPRAPRDRRFHPLTIEGSFIKNSWETLDAGALIECLQGAGPAASSILARLRHPEQYWGARAEARALRFLGERSTSIELIVPSSAGKRSDLRVHGPFLYEVEVASFGSVAEDHVVDAVIAHMIPLLDFARFPLDIDLELDGPPLRSLAAFLRKPSGEAMARKIATDIVAVVEPLLVSGTVGAFELPSLGVATITPGRFAAGTLGFARFQGEAAKNKIANAIDKAKQIANPPGGILWLDISDALPSGDAVPVVANALATHGKSFPGLFGALLFESQTTFNGVIEYVTRVGIEPRLHEAFEERYVVPRERAKPGLFSQTASEE